MDIYLFSIFVLVVLTIFNLIVGVSNDAVNFLNSSIGSKVAPRYIIFIVASLGMMAGVTFSSGMMEVARKGIFNPEFFNMPELMVVFLAVILTNIILLDLFNTFGLPTSTTVSIVFALLGASVALSVIKVSVAGNDFDEVFKYINTAKALTIIMGILFSVVIAFVCGSVIQFVSRIVFTFDYEHRLKRYGGIWGGLTLAMITYFILIKGAKGTSFLSPEMIIWVDTHAWTILTANFFFFAAIFQILSWFTNINILKPIILIGTFALAMAFAANDLVNFIGVPLAGVSAYRFANLGGNPLTATMEALRQPVQSNTAVLLIAGIIMVVTLWLSRKAKTVTQTELSLARQDEGSERFGSSTLSRIIVRIAYSAYAISARVFPLSVKRKIEHRMDRNVTPKKTESDEDVASFDMLRASVNLMVASAVVSFATSMKLPLSTTYVTFMVAMGSSLADQSWGRESAVYRVTGVLTVIGGWFFTAFLAFTGALVFSFILYFLKLPAIIGLFGLSIFLIIRTYQYHYKKESQSYSIESLSLKKVSGADEAVRITFKQTGLFLKEISDTLGSCIEAAFMENRQRLKDARASADIIETWSNTIVGNIFDTLLLLHKEDVLDTQKYSRVMRSVQAVRESHRDIVLRLQEHFDNCHSGFNYEQKEELRLVKANITRLLWNTSIMLLHRKKVDYDYITNQYYKLKVLIDDFDKKQIFRIQNGLSTTRLSILFYGILENTLEISEQTINLLEIFKDSFKLKKKKTSSA